MQYSQTRQQQQQQGGQYYVSHSPSQVQNQQVAYYPDSPSRVVQSQMGTQSGILNQQPQQVVYQSYQPQVQQSNKVYYVQQQNIQTPKKISQEVVYSQPVQPPVQKENVCTRWCYWCFPLIFAIVAIIAAVFLIKSMKKYEAYDITSASNIVEFVSENFETPPINNIQQVDDYEACPDNTEEVILASWSGVNYGCTCDDGLQYDDQTYCQENSCAIQGTIDAVDITYWYVGSIYRKICIGRVDDFTVTEDETCDDDDQFCAPNLCIDSGDTCPYTTITTTSNRRNLFEKHITSHLQSTDDSGVVTLDDAIYTFSVDTSGTTTFQDFGSTTGSLPCWDTGVAPEAESTLSNPFQVIPATGCGDYGDQVFVQALDSQLLSTIYESSSTLQTALDGVTDATTYYGNSQDYLQLYVQERIPYVTTNEFCASITTDYIDSVDELQVSMYKWLKILSWIIIILAAIIIVVTIALFFTKLIGSKNLLWIDTKQYGKVLYFVGVIASIFCLVVGIIYFCDTRTQGGFYDANDYYYTYHYSQCFENSDELSFLQAKDYLAEHALNIVEQVWRETTALFYSGMGFLVLGFILLSCRLIHYPRNETARPFSNIDSPLKSSNIQ